ncbi:MAG: manganese efflux pump [Deltaproteobacteria bacterium]|nr:manganese efflux pump [Deltaproteobacteria bacterium]
MHFSEIILIAVSLAMDAFAVSIASSCSGCIEGKRAAFRLSFHFGLFQAMMPVIGWFAGARIMPLVAGAGPMIAFCLLAFIGGRMILNGFSPEDPLLRPDPSKGTSLVMLSVATSIDALAVGFSLAMVNVSIWYPSAIIGIVTAGLSLAGIRLGRFLGKTIGPRMEIAGGLILVIIGFKILFN